MPYVVSKLLTQHNTCLVLSQTSTHIIFYLQSIFIECIFIEWIKMQDPDQPPVDPDLEEITGGVNPTHVLYSREYLRKQSIGETSNGDNESVKKARIQDPPARERPAVCFQYC